MQVIRFSQINRLNSADYRPNYHRHHLIPRQAGFEPALVRFFETMRDDGFSLDDFECNGILLPCCEEEARKTGKPLHRGPHPRYNEIVIERLKQISLLGDQLDQVTQRTNFIRFRILLLLSCLRFGLGENRFNTIYLNLRDPLRSNARFDEMDSRIERILKNRNL